MSSQTDDARVSFDDMDPVGTADRDDGESLKLQPGDKLVAEVRHIETGKSSHGNDLLHLTIRNADGLEDDDREDGELVEMWGNATISKAFDAADVTAGDVVGISKAAQPITYEDDDGEERQAYQFEVRAL
jgi:hypothetical protein